ncbi:hypothetical protein [Streptomyces sp. AM6-12]|uniref:hypothetical protein n=1 Tax=Streptomyces sp. AM6-12 TaxID=3345149 RepID=UPI00378BCB04
MPEQKPGSSEHMREHDLSFEHLADAVDASSQTRYGKHWQGPDPRMRRTTTMPVYGWPEGADLCPGRSVVVPGEREPGTTEASATAFPA